MPLLGSSTNFDHRFCNTGKSFGKSKRQLTFICDMDERISILIETMINLTKGDCVLPVLEMLLVNVFWLDILTWMTEVECLFVLNFGWGPLFIKEHLLFQEEYLWNHVGCFNSPLFTQKNLRLHLKTTWTYIQKFFTLLAREVEVWFGFSFTKNLFLY